MKKLYLYAATFTFSALAAYWAATPEQVPVQLQVQVPVPAPAPFVRSPAASDSPQFDAARGPTLERMMKLQALRKIAGHDAEVREAALNEMTQNVPEPRPNLENAETEEEKNLALSTTLETARVSAADQIFLERTADAQTALAGTLQGVLAQRDHGIRAQLAVKFAERFPEHRQELATALLDAGASAEARILKEK